MTPLPRPSIHLLVSLLAGLASAAGPTGCADPTADLSTASQSTCEGFCGFKNPLADCFCDERCHEMGDCCPGVEEVCNAGPGNDGDLGDGADGQPDVGSASDIGNDLPERPACAELSGPESSFTLLDQGTYLTCHNDDWKIPLWTAYLATAESLAGTQERTDDFRADPMLAVGSRAELEDYDQQGFDRGHLAPANDFRRSEQAMSSTFVLSNVIPQVADFNRGLWRELEMSIHGAIEDQGRGYVITGSQNLGLLDGLVQSPHRIGANRVGVPNHVFKVVLIESPATGARGAYAWIMLNMNGASELHAFSVDEVEALAGVDFFSWLPDAEEASLEAVARPWPFP